MRLRQLEISKNIEEFFDAITDKCDEVIKSNCIAGLDYKLSLEDAADYVGKQTSLKLEIEINESESAKKIVYNYQFSNYLVIDEYSKDEDDFGYNLADCVVIHLENADYNKLTKSSINLIDGIVDFFEDKAHDKDVAEEQNDYAFITSRYEESFDGLVD